MKRGLTIDQQSKVDAMADALEAAIKGLTLKSQAPGDNKGDGTQSGTHKGDDISKTGATCRCSRSSSRSPRALAWAPWPTPVAA